MLTISLSLLGCSLFESTESKQTKACVTDVKLGLNDPNSLEILSVEKIKVDNGWYRIKLNFTAKNAMGGRVRGDTICGFKTAQDVDLNPDDFMNKSRELARKLNELGIKLK
jgi:hypothetical protein